MVKFQNSLSLPSSLFMNSCQVLWCISWVKSRECRLSNFDSRHLRVNHKPMKMPIWSDIKTFHSNWTKCLIYKYISDQHYIFLPPIRSSTQSPCLPSSVIPTSLLRSPGSRFRLLRHVRPDHFFFSFLSDHSTSSTLCIIFSWPVNTALMD